MFNNDGLFIVPELQRRLAIANQKVGPDVWKKVADVWDGLHFDAKALEQMFVTYNKGEPVGMRGMVDMAKMIFVLSADALLHLLRGLGEEPRDFMMGIRTTERTRSPTSTCRHPPLRRIHGAEPAPSRKRRRPSQTSDSASTSSSQPPRTACR